MILLALAKTGRIRGHSSINNQRTAIIFLRLLQPATLLPRGETLFHLPPIKNLEIFQDFSSTTRKYSKTFHQQPENIQRLFRMQNCLSRISSAPENIQKLFCLQNFLSRKPSAAEIIQRVFRLQNCRSRKSTITRK